MKIVAIAILAGCGLFAVTNGVQASSGTDGPIKLIVPFGPGSSVDSTARPFAQALGMAIGQTVVVDNRAGAEGLIGARAVINAPPDGKTALFTSNSVPTLLPALRKIPPFEPTDLLPVCAISKAPMNVFIRSSLPHKTLGEFVADAKANPQKYTFATSTGLTRLTAAWFQQITGIQLRDVPYKATAQALVDIMSGQVDLIMADASTAMGHYRDGKLRPLVTANDTRSAALPDAPSAPEAGIKGFSVSVWFAVYLPANTPGDVIARLEQALKTAANSPTVKEADLTGGRESMVLCGEDLARMQQSELDRWRALVSSANIELH